MFLLFLLAALQPPGLRGRSLPVAADKTWAPDREDIPGADPDSEDFMPIAKAQPPGNPPVRATPRDQTTGDDDDDCQILDVLDPTPLNFSFPPPSPSAKAEVTAAAPTAPAQGKRAPADNPAGPQQKKRKKLCRKPLPLADG